MEDGAHNFELANFSSLGSTMGRTIAKSFSTQSRAGGTHTTGSAGLDLHLDDNRCGGGAGDESLASIDMGNIPPASPALSRETATNPSANAHLVLRGGAPMGNIMNSNARPREDSGSGHTRTQQVFSSTRS